jgi:hypothetical protein
MLYSEKKKKRKEEEEAAAACVLRPCQLFSPSPVLSVLYTGASQQENQFKFFTEKLEFLFLTTN